MSIRDRIPICPHGKVENLDSILILALERLEKALNHDLEFVSGFRCYDCNLKAGGVKNSAHCQGLAVDVRASTSGERFHILYWALDLNFKRIGIGRNFIHLDIDYDLPQHVVWLY